MKVLELNRQVFVSIWILPTPIDNSKWIKFRNMFVGISSLILVFAGLVASVYFAYKFLNVDLELAFHALLQICAWSSQSYMIVVSFILWHKFLDMFPKLQQIYDENKHLDTFKFMEKAQQRSVIITKLLTNHMVIGWFLYCSLLGISSMIFSIIKFGHIDPKHLDVPFKFLLPWVQQTVYGWIAELVFSMFSGGAYFVINSSLLSFFIGICLYHRAYHKVIRALIDRFNNVDRHSDQKAILINIIRFHNSAKEIFHQSADVYSICILILLVCSIMLMALSIFQLDLAFRNINPGIVLILISIFVSATNLYLYCFYGHLAHETYLALSDCFFQANWLILSSDLQKYFIKMLANAQRPLFYHGFGVAHLHLNTFLRMMRTVVSYYLSFKTLAA